MDAMSIRDNSYYLQRQAQRESNARSYPRRFPIAIRTASGCILTDIDGKTYIDCLAGAGTLALGHNHPEVLDTLRDVLNSGLPLHTLDLTTPVKDTFVSNLLDTLPSGLHDQAKIQFCSPSGSDAIEAAIKLAKTVTGRSDIISFRGAYHGMTQGSLSLMGSVAPKAAIGSLLAGSHFFPYPYQYRCPFGRGGEETTQLAIEYLERALRDPEGGINRPAAIILEVIQGEGGVIEAPAEWLKAIRRITEELGILLILDEVQTGAGRTGTFYAFEKAGIVPDIIAMSKAIGGGLPLAVILYHQKLDLWKAGAHAGTFRGNQLAMAAGSKTLEIIGRDQLSQHASVIGTEIKTALQQIAVHTPYIGDVRGRGLMLGIEIVNPHGAPDKLGRYPHSSEIAALVQREAFYRGLIVETGGRHGSVLRLLPPLTLTREEATRIITIFSDIFTSLERQVA